MVFADETGASTDPPVRRTWGRRGRTPLIAVNRGPRARVNATGWLCVGPQGKAVRLVFSTSRTGFTHYDFPELIDRVHQRLGGGPVVLVWDNHASHKTRWLRGRLGAREWLTVVLLPRYAPELNPVEALWSQLKRRIANRAYRSLDELENAMRSYLLSAQKRRDVLAGFVRSAHLTPDPIPSTT
ncbi:IS630 family transposase [Nocardiopsis rhodophaea]|uniref:IS630 family transposase n=1 Tax=Nocardiopsis rhodophaea TaxID=280238 RepID=UPI0031DC8DA7